MLQRPAVFQEFATSSRLRWGVGAILGILWIYGLLVVADKVEALRQTHLAAAKKTARTVAILAETAWPQRLTEARRLQGGYEARLWHESSPGLAQAALQDWLNREVAAVEIAKPVVTVAIHREHGEAGRIEDRSGLWRVSARLTGVLTGEQLARLLADIAASKQRITVDALKIRRSGVVLQVEINLLAHFRPLRADSEPAQGATERAIPPMKMSAE